ncbi:stage III sporulation protein SpoIIIAB [Lederbergia citrea]|uniref:Stage III sporulation protein SpoAB n=1 Tax=Lederbergia citrea TaxID=2833581 RepID=A0A942Z511_9BACI|nr:stage III sporulation protein SpoIIIAB [Lederbergia citrea]MBS4176376.1 stage III sporulation protein SpoAB [Lederbergia citrea]MBS4202937.1 stage III sporulation protein SpoAB [Lederbergia citrea]MBS4222391.1 stage III sporulation protein SpoAB [Lederbergia citrea]
MIKIIGAICILGATTWAGFESSKKLSERPKQLQLFRNSLQTLDAEIMYGHTPLGEASRKIAAQLPDPVASHYKIFAERLGKEGATVKSAWGESLKEVWSRTALKQSEYEILLQFGENLGRHDRLTQQKQIMLTLVHLEREEEGARDRQKNYEKMVKSLGVLIGMLFIILLL